MSDRYKGAILSPTAPTVTQQSAGGIYTLSQQTQYQGQGVWPTAVNYPINNSLRFRASASARLTRTPTVASNRKTWTVSFWYKPSTIFSNGPNLFQAGYNSAPWTALTSDSSGTFDIAYTAGSSPGSATSATYRDPAAWYHVVWATDTTQATASNRMKFYINGVLQTLSSTSYPSQNFDTPVNNTVQHSIGGWAGQYFDGYLGEVNFIDGVALTPSSFGTTDAYGIWQPIPYTGSYGTNGFYLPFTDNSALTTSSNVGLGKDFSGNGNYWTTNGISITAGSTYDSMKDVPTNTNSNTANYATLNPLNTGGGTYSNGNLQWVSPATDLKSAQSTVALNTASTGKWYWEVTCVSKTGTNYQVMLTASSTSYNTNPWLQYRSSDGVVTINGSSAGTFSTFTTGDVIGVTFDASNSQVALYKNNTLVTTQTISNTSNTYIYAALGSDSSGGTMTYAINFGQRPFAYTPPTGFLPLNTYNLPTPTILAGNQYMDATTYSGNSSTQSITNSGSIQPDFVWIKSRTDTSWHQLYDSVRGALNALFSNTTNAESAQTNTMTGFASNGFTLGSDLAGGSVNASGKNYVAWQWRANAGTNVSNTQGTITSTVSANTTAGFSIFTYTGNGTAGATVGHGLGVAPNFIFIKCRSNSPTNWFVGGSNIASAGNGTWSSVMEGLNTTNAINTGATSVFNSTAPTSSLVTLGTEANANGSGRTFVMYCWTAVAGYSAFGSYTGNGSTDGPFIYTGFRPRFVLIKRTDSGNNWFILDTSRDTFNLANDQLLPNSSAAESTNTDCNIDILSNGFKLRTALDASNGSGGTYIYACFAENPFKISRAR